jgi:hypothetical protein
MLFSVELAIIEYRSVASLHGLGAKSDIVAVIFSLDAVGVSLA